MTEAFDKIAAGQTDAIAYAKGDTSKGRLARPDVKAIRAKTRLSQAKFAEMPRAPVASVRDREQRRRIPDAPARTLLDMVDVDLMAALASSERMG